MYVVISGHSACIRGIIIANLLITTLVVLTQKIAGGRLQNPSQQVFNDEIQTTLEDKLKQKYT